VLPGATTACLLWFDSLVPYSSDYDVRCVQSLLLNLHEGFVSHSDSSTVSGSHLTAWRSGSFTTATVWSLHKYRSNNVFLRADMVVLCATTDSDCLLWFDALVLYSSAYDVRCVQHYLSIWMTDLFHILKEEAQQFLIHIQQYDLQAYHLMHFNVIYTEVKCK